MVTWWHVFFFEGEDENLQSTKTNRGPLDKEIPFWKPSFLEFMLAFGGVLYNTKLMRQFYQVDPGSSYKWGEITVFRWPKING